MPRYSVSFQWAPGEYDAEFHRLNAIIDAVAKANPGYDGVESWRSPDGRRGNAVYYWTSLEALQAFATHPAHLATRRRHRHPVRTHVGAVNRGCCDSRPSQSCRPSRSGGAH